MPLFLFFCCCNIFCAQFRFGGAQVDITPDFPVRLSGYAARKTESEGVAQPLFAKVLAIESDKASKALFITADNCAVPLEIRNAIVEKLQRAHDIPASQVVIFSSHTHSAPCLTDAIPNIFVAPLSEKEQVHVDLYTRMFVTNILKAASNALSQMQEASLHFTKGTAGFAKNRRTPGGPVDHDLPVLIVKDTQGRIKAVLGNYACHCTTLQGDRNQIHPDWAGVAQAIIQRENPGVLAMMAIGCGADSNPLPRGTVEHVQTYGGEIAAEIGRLMAGPLQKIDYPLEFRTRKIQLPFDSLPSREEWVRRSSEEGIVGYHARRNLERLDRGEKLPSALDYYVQTWNFGSQLAFVFLAGEVVVDYSLRLKSIYDPDRIWVSGYANWVPCYIPSERILREGGYEAEQSLWYYDCPARLSPKTEELIITTVEALLPTEFKRK